MTKTTALVAIHCLVYNHEPYLRDCLEGFVMQQTNFPFVAIVHDDASTDGSAAIIREYEEKYPNIIKPIYEKENQWRKGTLTKVMNTAIEAIGAKYVAMCEGDDYWTDPLKLQKQVDFMEANPEYSITSHRYTIYNHEERVFTQDYLADLFEDKKNVFGIAFERKNYLDYPYMQTMTVMYKNDCFNYNYYTKLPIKGDLSLFYVSLLGGKGYCLNFDGAVYRRSNTGVYAKKSWDQKHFVGFNLYSKMYLYTQDIVFLPHALSHKDLVLSDIKNNILEGKTINKKCLRDVLCFLWKIGRMQEVIKRWLKIYYWKIKYMFKRTNCYC